MALIRENITFNRKMLEQPITHAALVLLGFSDHPCDYYCPPSPAHGGMYRIGVGGAGQYYVYLTDENATRVRNINTLEQLNNIHKGFCDKALFTINNY